MRQKSTVIASSRRGSEWVCWVWAIRGSFRRGFGWPPLYSQSTQHTPRVPAATRSWARARTERSLSSSSFDARFMRYLACATTGETPSSRAPSTRTSASRRGTGSAQPWGLETKIWTVSHPSSRADFRVFANPPEVGRCLPMLFVRCGMAAILQAAGRDRCERYNLRERLIYWKEPANGRRRQGGKDSGQQRNRHKPRERPGRPSGHALRGLR